MYKSSHIQLRNKYILFIRILIEAKLESKATK